MAAEEREGVLSIWDVPLQHLFSIVTGFYRKGEAPGKCRAWQYMGGAN